MYSVPVQGNYSQKKSIAHKQLGIHELEREENDELLELLNKKMGERTSGNIPLSPSP